MLCLIPFQLTICAKIHFTLQYLHTTQYTNKWEGIQWILGWILWVTYELYGMSFKLCRQAIFLTTMLSVPFNIVFCSCMVLSCNLSSYCESGILSFEREQHLIEIYLNVYQNQFVNVYGPNLYCPIFVILSTVYKTGARKVVLG